MNLKNLLVDFYNAHIVLKFGCDRPNVEIRTGAPKILHKIAKTRRWHVTIIIMPTGWTPTAASSTLEEWTRTFSRGQQCICFTITVF